MATDDDIFASLGGSLMEDLMSDINAAATAASPSGGDGGSDGINVTLASLERELADFTGGNDDNDAGNQSTLPPPPPPPGVGPHATRQPSAASMVVNHAAERGKFDAPSAPSSMPAQREGNGGEDAWSVSLSKFSALSLAEDFLKADSAKKMGEAPAAAGPPPGIGAPAGIGGGGGGGGKLTFEDAEDYDVKEKVLVGGPPGLNVPPPPSVGRPPMQGPPAGVGPPPGHGAPSQMQHDHHHQQQRQRQLGQQMQQQKGAPGLNVSPPPGVGQQVPPPGVGPPSHRPPPQQQYQQGQMSGPRPLEVGLPRGPPLQGSQQGGVPPGTMMPPPGQGMPPPHIMAMMQQQQMQGRGPGGPPPPNMMGMHPTHMMGMPPPQRMDGPPPPMGVGSPPQMGMQPPQPHVMQRQMQQGQVQGPPQKHLQELPPPPRKEDPLEAESAFKKKDFPTLGKAVAVAKDSDKKDAKGDSDDKGKEEEEDDGEAPLIPSKSSLALPSTPTKAPIPEPQIQRRVIFNDPNPAGHPVPATVVQSSLMPPRDLCYVVHSMIRPLHTSDRYSDDYYHWSYVDRQSRNILMLGVGGSSGGTNLPAPVWKETKVKAQAAEEKYIASVESRAKDWMEDKSTLGHVVKTNVKRPRALLSTPVLSRKDSQGSEDEEDGIRLGLWKARVAIDRGYGAYLRLVELRRLLQSDGTGARSSELVRDVEEEVSNLHSSLGVTVKQESESAPEIRVDLAILARTLSLPKGRLLLARLVEGGILPHPSACKVLPAVVAVLFNVKLPSGGAPPPGEDRLLRSLTGLVRTVQPSLGSRDVLSCLDAVMELDDCSKGGEGIGAAMSSRTRMELIHSVLSRGGMICVEGEEGKEWKEKEGRFMTMLQQSQGGGQKTSGL